MVLLCSGPDARASDPAAAKELFDKGRVALEAGKWPEACRMFRASFDFDPSVGALLNIAKCHAHEQRWASALSTLEQARLLNRKAPAERRQKVDSYISKHVRHASEKVPRLQITVRPRVEGLSVTRNGIEVPLSGLDIPLPVDPGSIELVASAPGQRASQTVEAAEGRIVAVELVLAPFDSKLPPVDTSAPIVGPVLPPAGDSAGVPTWAWVSGSVGLALGIGAMVAAGDYAATASELADFCGDQLATCVVHSDEERGRGEDLNSRKNHDMILGLTLGGAGGAMLVAAIIGGVMGRSDSESQPSVGIGLAASSTGLAASITLPF